MLESITYRWPRQELPDTATCPNCHGLGHMCDGMLSYQQTATDNCMTYRPSTVCYACKGKGRVRVHYEPLES